MTRALNRLPIQIDNLTLSLVISGCTPDMAWDSLSPGEWELLIGKAQAEGVAPLLYWVLSRSGVISTFPEPVHQSLRSIYAGTWMQNQLIFRELEILAKLFDRKDIPVVVLKGACFALTIYPDPGLRPMGDLDLLVPASKLQEALQITEENGYKCAAPEASPGLSMLLDHAICLQKSGESPIKLELHRNLVGERAFTYAVPVEWFWGQIEPLDGASRGRFGNLHMLTPTAQVLYGAAHAALQHGGKNAPLRWYYDLDHLIRVYAERMDWDLLLSQARIFDWSSALDAAISRTSGYFNTPIPAPARAALSEYSDRHKKLVALLQKRPATHVLEEQQKLIRLTWYGRFRLVLALLVPSPAYMRWRYKFQTPWPLPIYYLIRWWGVFKDGLRTLGLLFR